jgi:hypothetical protein
LRDGVCGGGGVGMKDMTQPSQGVGLARGRGCKAAGWQGGGCRAGGGRAMAMIPELALGVSR